uniref:FLYWCH-type domain-containing protein n=1 Tax=Anopheles atroparvus TaxID=41427 RepID=A0A182JIY3_ANOAO
MCIATCNVIRTAPNGVITIFRKRLTFIQGQRGNKLLVVGGYTYARNNHLKSHTIYWACRTSYDHQRCNSRVVTTLLENGQYRIVITNPKHTHPRRVALSKEFMLGTLKDQDQSNQLPAKYTKAPRTIKLITKYEPHLKVKQEPWSNYDTEWLPVKEESRGQRSKSSTNKKKQTKWLKMDLTPVLQQPSVPVVLVPCRLGGMKVLHRNFFFDHHIAKGRIKHYRCVEHAQRNCPARIIVKDSKVYDVEAFHNHSAGSGTDPKRKAEHRNHQAEFERPEPLLQGVHAIRSSRPVPKFRNADGKQRKARGGSTPKPLKRQTLTVAEIQAGSSGSPVVYLASRFGSAKVVLDEHHYVYHFASNGVAYYRCEHFKRMQCPAQVLVVAGKTYPLMNEHTHAVDANLQETVCTQVNKILGNTLPSAKEKLPSADSSDENKVQKAPKKAKPATPAKRKVALNYEEITSRLPEPMRLVPTLKGSAGVEHRGHHFEFHYTRKQHKLYRCAWHGSHKCQAQVLMLNKLFYVVCDEHTHEESSHLSRDVLGKNTLKNVS